MEMNIVHYGQSIGHTAEQLILSFVFKRAPSVYNKFLEKLEFLIYQIPQIISEN